MADKEPPDLIGRIHGFLGMKPSEEEQAEIDRIKREGQAANAKLKETLDADLERVRRGLEATAAAEHQSAQTELDRVREQAAHMPKKLDSVNDRDALMQATMNREDIVSVRNRTTIYQWDDGYGNIIYLNPDVSMRQVQAVSTRITEQKGAFDILGSDDQTQIRTVFNLATPTESTTPYQDFLKSEVLGKRFQELKQKSTPTK